MIVSQGQRNFFTAWFEKFSPQGEGKGVMLS